MGNLEEHKSVNQSIFASEKMHFKLLFQKRLSIFVYKRFLFFNSTPAMHQQI